MKITNLNDFDLDDVSLEDIDKYVQSHEKELSPKQMSTQKNTYIDFGIEKVFGELSDRKNAPIFALINWHGYVRYDVRGWSADMTKPRKGMSFNEEELRDLIRYSEVIDLSKLGVTLRVKYEKGKAKALIYERICRLAEIVRPGIIWYKEVNVVDWGWGKKVDLRKWTENYDKCSKGIGITFDEYRRFMELVQAELNYYF